MEPADDLLTERERETRDRLERHLIESVWWPEPGCTFRRQLCLSKLAEVRVDGVPDDPILRLADPREYALRRFPRAATR